MQSDSSGQISDDESETEDTGHEPQAGPSGQETDWYESNYGDSHSEWAHSE